MATEKKVTFNAHGEPTVVVTITGWHDAFRFAWALGHLQVEFADMGRRIGGSLKRRLGAKGFTALNKHFTGNESLRWMRNDEELADA